MTTTIYLLRHGETLFNVQGKTQGWCDSPLTERGIEQARLTGAEYRRRGIRIDHAYSSTSERCCDTLELVCEAAFGAPVPYERLKGLKELNFGAFEGKDQFLECHDREKFNHFYVQYGGEDFDEAVLRLERTLAGLAERHEGESLLCCSHGGIAIQFFNRWKERAKVSRLLFANCLTYVYEVDDAQFSCTDLFVPDLSSLERPGMPPQVRSFDL